MSSSKDVSKIMIYQWINLRRIFFGFQWIVVSIIVLNRVMCLEAVSTDFTDTTQQSNNITSSEIRNYESTPSGFQTKSTEIYVVMDEHTENTLQTNQEIYTSEKISTEKISTENDTNERENNEKSFPVSTDDTINIIQVQEQTTDSIISSSTTDLLQTAVTDVNVTESTTTTIVPRLMNTTLPNVIKIISNLNNKLHDVANVLNQSDTHIDVNKFLDSFNILNIWKKKNPDDKLTDKSVEKEKLNEKYVYLQLNQYSKKTGELFNTILSTKDLTKHTSADANVDDNRKSKKVKKGEYKERVQRSNNFTYNPTSMEDLDKNALPKSLLTIINTGHIQNIRTQVTLKQNNYIFNNDTVEPGIHFISRVINESLAHSIGALLSTSFKNKADLNIFGKKGKKKLIKTVAKSISDSIVVIINTGTINGLMLNLPGPNKCSNNNDPNNPTPIFSVKDMNTKINYDNEIISTFPAEYSNEKSSETPIINTSTTDAQESTTLNSENEITISNFTINEFESNTNESNLDEDNEQSTNMDLVTDLTNAITTADTVSTSNASSSQNEDNVLIENTNSTPSTDMITDVTEAYKKESKREIITNYIDIPINETQLSKDEQNVRSIIDYLKFILNDGKNSTRKNYLVKHENFIG